MSSCSVSPPPAMAPILLHSCTSPSLLFLRPPQLCASSLQLSTRNKQKNALRKVRSWRCKAEFSQDVPFAMAIGACILNSIAFPAVHEAPENDDESSPIDSTDTRFAAMGLIGFIPYFNWMSWVFAWLDTGKQRYLVYSIVYLAPYLRTNLSLSPEESWLPISSILICLAHIQLEDSIRNGDLQDTQFFSSIAEIASTITRKKKTHFKIKKERKKKQSPMLTSHDERRDELQGWDLKRKPSERVSEDEDIERRGP